jgi:hypothetical protein
MSEHNIRVGGWDIPLLNSEPEASLEEDPHSEVTCILKTHKNLIN